MAKGSKYRLAKNYFVVERVSTQQQAKPETDQVPEVEDKDREGNSRHSLQSYSMRLTSKKPSKYFNGSCY